MPVLVISTFWCSIEEVVGGHPGEGGGGCGGAEVGGVGGRGIVDLGAFKEGDGGVDIPRKNDILV